MFVQMQAPEPNWRAWSMLWADEGDGRNGEVSFRQISPVNPVLVNINATGLPPGKHAVHIHAYGDMRERCRSTGPHVRGILVCCAKYPVHQYMLIKCKSQTRWCGQTMVMCSLIAVCEPVHCNIPCYTCCTCWKV